MNQFFAQVWPIVEGRVLLQEIHGLIRLAPIKLALGQGHRERQRFA
jgi:hypothetical protein